MEHITKIKNPKQPTALKLFQKKREETKHGCKGD